MLKWHLTFAKCIVRNFNQYVTFYLIIIGVRLFGQDTALLRILHNKRLCPHQCPILEVSTAFTFFSL